MSEPVSALNGVSFDGLVRIEECGVRGMISLRGDLGASVIKKAVKAAIGGNVPAPLTIATGSSGAVAWMSPDEALVLCDYDSVKATVREMQDILGDAHALVVNVSDARVMFKLSGAEAREVLAKLCPVDFAPGSFEPGTFRRTRMAQIPAAIWMEADGTFGVICFRSVADYAFDLLKTAAMPGSGVKVF